MNTEQSCVCREVSNMEERRLSLLFVHLLCTKFYLKFMADVSSLWMVVVTMMSILDRTQSILSVALVKDQLN